MHRILFIVLVIGATPGCDRPGADDEVSYDRDPRAGFCFAREYAKGVGVALATVPCTDQVMELIKGGGE